MGTYEMTVAKTYTAVKKEDLTEDDMKFFQIKVVPSGKKGSDRDLYFVGDKELLLDDDWVVLDDVTKEVVVMDDETFQAFFSPSEK